MTLELCRIDDRMYGNMLIHSLYELPYIVKKCLQSIADFEIFDICDNTQSTFAHALIAN